MAREDDSILGLSTKLGVWCLGGEEEAVALRISFSVCVRCKRSFSRSLSDCSDDVVVVRRLSLVSRSRTWRSLRSRKALCLPGQMSVLKRLRKSGLTYAALFCAFRRDCAGVKSSLSTLFDLLSCPGIPSSRSRAMPFSKESLGSSEMCCAMGDAELELCAAPEALPPDPTDASKL